MQVLFGRYLHDNIPLGSEAYELKIVTGDSIPFDKIKDHQVKALVAVEGSGLYHRITDQPWMKDRAYSYTLKKPFDCFCLTNAKGYLVIWFYKARALKRFWKIRIGDFLRLRDSCGRKSMTEAMAEKIAESCLVIK